MNFLKHHKRSIENYWDLIRFSLKVSIFYLLDKIEVDHDHQFNK